MERQRTLNSRYLLTYSLTYLLTYLLTYIITSYSTSTNIVCINESINDYSVFSSIFRDVNKSKGADLSEEDLKMAAKEHFEYEKFLSHFMYSLYFKYF